MKKYSIALSETSLHPMMTLRRLYEQFLTNRYLRHNMLLLITNVLAGAFSYLLHPFLGHVMSIQDYGQVATFISLTLVLSTPTQIIATVAAKYASSLSTVEQHAQLNDFIRRLTGILLVAGAVTTVAFVALSSSITFFFHLNSPQEMLFLSLIFLISFSAPLNQGVLQGVQFFGWYAALSLLTAFLRMILAVILVFIGLGVNGAIIGIVLSAILTYLTSFFPLRKFLQGPRTHVGSLRSLWFYSILTAVAATGIVALYSIDTVLAKHFLSGADAGLYAALATMGRTGLFVTNSVAIIMFPRVVALHERGESHTSVVVQALLGVLALSVVVEGAFFLAPSLLTRLLFGQTFMPIAGLLPLYGLAMLILAFAQVLAMYFLAISNRLFVGVIFLACALQVLLIVWYHATIFQVVKAVLISNVALTFGLLGVWLLVYRKDKVRKRTT